MEFSNARAHSLRFAAAASMKTRRPSGQALVEFALVLPLLMLLIFGIISYGLYINANVTVQEAARIGARTLALGNALGCPGDSAELQAAAAQSASSASPSPSSSPSPGPATPSSVTVYGVVDDQIANGFGMSVNNSSDKAIAVLTYNAGTNSSGATTSEPNTVWEYTNTSDPSESYAVVEVFYPYHPIIAIPGLLPSTIMLHQTYSMMVQTPQPSGDLSSPAPSPSGSTTPSGAYEVVQPGCPSVAYPAPAS